MVAIKYVVFLLYYWRVYFMLHFENLPVITNFVDLIKVNIPPKYPEIVKSALKG